MIRTAAGEPAALSGDHPVARACFTQALRYGATPTTDQATDEAQARRRRLLALVAPTGRAPTTRPRSTAMWPTPGPKRWANP